MTTEATWVESGALQARIDELWDFDDPAASESRFRVAAGDAAIDRQRDILMTQVARALGLQDRYAEGMAILDAIPKADGDLEVEVRTRLERGRILNTRGDRDEARPEFDAAFDGATNAELENLAVDALHMIAIVAPADEQLALSERAIALANAATDPRARRWLASLYNNTAWTHFDAGNLDEALRLFELALDERVKVNKPRETGIARWAVARTLRAQGRTDEALAAQRDLKRFNAEAGIDDSYVEEELGECLLALGRLDEARPHFAKAAEGISADAWMLANKPARIARLQELGRTA
ncbi:MAG: tetratricopeptide repeat protein [Chloroflexota bacterium]|nr:tetratricopeptide repeat protein [Chloroflexota bacterium]